MTERIVVIGAGLAAATVVGTLREEGYPGAITLVGDEPYRPYERPGLSKEVLQGGAEVDSLFVHEEGFYEASGIETRFGDAATAIDRPGRRVALASGDDLAYDALVLATGARARTVDLPGADLAGVRTLRTIPDALALRAAFKPGRGVVIVGGGWIGLEAAAAASLAGCLVTVVERGRLPLLKVMGEQVAGHFAALHRAHGVDLRTEAGVEGFEGGDGHVRAVRSDGGLLPADVVLVGVGAIPTTTLAEQAGLAVNDGVLVDDRLVTTDPAIWAAGDVVNARHATLGRLRVEHWDNAVRQGRLAALSVLGRPDRYDWQPYFYTDQYDLSMEYVGHGSPDAEVVLRGDPESGAFLTFWLEAGTVTAAMNVNTPDVNPALRELIGLELDAHRLADPGVGVDDLARG